jgi:ABC-type transport system substrate-binding protein
MVVILVLLALMAAPGVRAQEQPAGKVTFTVGIINDVDSLNPFIGILAETYEVWALMYDYLVGYSQKDFSPVPGLAESWQVSDDELTWTYKIRQGVKWSDGQPLTAKDAAYTFNRIMKGSFEQTNYGNYVSNIKTVDAPDDTTLVMTTKKPSPSMLRLAVPILPEHIWKNIDEKEVSTFDNEKNAVGSGPFVLAERSTGQFVRLTVNKSYWGGAPRSTSSSTGSSNNADAMIQAIRRVRSTSPTGSTRRRSTRSRTPRGSPPWPATTPASTSWPSTPGRPLTAASRSATATRPSRTSGSGRRSPTPSTSRPWSSGCWAATAPRPPGSSPASTRT